LRGVRGRQIQGVDRNSLMRRMFPRHVFNNRRGLRVINMPSLLARLQVFSSELNLHVQCGLLGT